ncbi:MAG: hypothetical protein CIT01_04870 [Methanobacterium sp. BRmetb2]|nr:MAG: hypothetical protein CIT01_04870 [Methanobacterium sp. BRmetb2]
MDQRHQEYIKYYRSRMLKYKNNPLYKNSFETEKSLYNAISNSKNLDEFGKKIEENNLTVKNAIALVKDQETARKKHLKELKEYVKLKAPLRILEIIDSMESDMELVETVSKIEADVNIEISIDLMTDYFYNDFLSLEEIEVYKSAEVPEKWQNEINHEYPQEMISLGRENWTNDVLPSAHNWDPQWEFDFDLIWEERNRRLIPVSDEVVRKRIEQFKIYRGI